MPMSFTTLHISALPLFALLPLLVLAALPSPLQTLLPVCAQPCLQDFVHREADASICPDSADLDCLCSHYDSDGYTIGERAYACLYTTGCTQTSRSNATLIFSVCANRNNSVTPTHKTLLITATPPTTTSSTVSIAIVKTASRATLPATLSIVPTPSAVSATSMSSGVTFTSGPDGTKTSVNGSLTMAQIAGITIAAAALLILTIGIACCLMFVRKRNKKLEPEDQKALVYDNSPASQHSPHVLSAPRKDPRSETAGAGSKPLQRHPQQPQRIWPKYYPVVPDERAIEAIVNQFPPRSTFQPSCHSQLPLNDSGRMNQRGNHSQDQQRTGICLPPSPSPPTQAQNRSSKSPLLSFSKTVQTGKVVSSTSSATDSKEVEPSLRPRSSFAGSRSMSGMDFGKWPRPPDSAIPGSVPGAQRRGRTSRCPDLAITIPKAVQTVPAPLPLALQRPPLARHDATQQVPARQWPLPPPSHRRQSSNSSAIASSQALGALSDPGTSQSSERSASNSRRPSKSSARSDSRASYTSFESMGSDDDPTPPKEDDKRLSPLNEGSVLHLCYPKIPRNSNQVVPRTPPSLRNREHGVSSLGSFTGSQGSLNSPNLNPSWKTSHNLGSSPSPVVLQSIGNRLWKTEVSPRATKPQCVTRETRTGHGVVPRLTPRKKGGNLALDASR